LVTGLLAESNLRLIFSPPHSESSNRINELDRIVDGLKRKLGKNSDRIRCFFEGILKVATQPRMGTIMFIYT
jgi:hypothetical protein